MENPAIDIHDQDLIKNLLFLEAWEQGAIPWSRAASVVIRVRQLHRANPELQSPKSAFRNSDEAALGRSWFALCGGS
jgi:hypothetical protein